MSDRLTKDNRDRINSIFGTAVVDPNRHRIDDEIEALDAERERLRRGRDHMGEVADGFMIERDEARAEVRDLRLLAFTAQEMWKHWRATARRMAAAAREWREEEGIATDNCERIAAERDDARGDLEAKDAKIARVTGLLRMLLDGRCPECGGKMLLERALRLGECRACGYHFTRADLRAEISD